MSINWFKQKIGFRLSIYAVLISILFAVISSIILLSYEYYKNKRHVIESADTLIKAVVPQLEKAIWYLDDEAKSAAVESLEKSNLMKNIILTEDKIPSSNYHVKKVIEYEQEVLSTLYFQYDFSGINDVLFREFKVTAYLLLITLIIMGLSIYFLVDASIIRHISRISAFARKKTDCSLNNFKPFSFKKRIYNDELEGLVNAVNQGKQTAIELLNAREEYNLKMQHQLDFDTLTGLPQRHKFEKHLQEKIEFYRETNKKFAVYFIDVDDFKLVNDSIGYSSGDELLKKCAQKLKSVFRKHDSFIGRLGGDEFIACVEFDSIDEIKRIGEAVNDEFRNPVTHQNFCYRLSCSLGISLYPEHSGGAGSPQELISNADKAKQKAKQIGKKGYFIFDEKMMDTLVLEREIKTKIQYAYENKLFELHFQPLVNIINNEIVGFEALIRWKDKDLGWIPPDIFISVAEKTGIMFDIDSWVFREAVRQVKQWREKYNKDFIISINFSPSNFYHSGFLNMVNNEWDIGESLDWVELEITERIMLNNDTTVMNGLQTVCNKGIRFSIDDFGIGYSSLGYINKFSKYLSKIKIDRMFIKTLTAESAESFDMAFVKSIKLLADNLHLQVLAEGVEEVQQIDKLRSVGCQYVQGYFYSRPLHPSKIPDFISNWPQKIAVAS